MIKKIICWILGHDFDVSDEFQNLYDIGMINGEIESKCKRCGEKGKIK